MEDFKIPTTIVAAKAEAPIVKPESITRKQANICPYKVPKFSGLAPNENKYKFEVLKSGQIIEEINELQNQAYWKFGRLPENDIEMAHPTISRFHAILQYRPNNQNTANDSDDGDDDTEANTKSQPPEGWYIYDLGSTHGTFLNKQRIPAKVFVRIRVGHMLRLGASTRCFILQGPCEDEEPESELSVTELKEQRLQKEAEAIALAARRAAEEEERKRNEGVSWGMAEDADEATDLSHNPFASTANEELFLDDPKKTLRGFFEREGLTLEYKCDEMSAGSFVCRVELPLDDDMGRPIVAEVVHKGKKKDCVVQCALEACRILDRHGVLRQANQEPMKRKHTSKESDSDDDEFWDRTGDVERKKQRKATSNTTTTLTHEDLIEQDKEFQEQLRKIGLDITKYQETEKRLKALKVDQQKNGDDLDSFMESLANEDETKLDKTEIRKLRLEQQRLRAEQQKVQRLIKLTKPLYMPIEGCVVAAVDDAANISKPEATKKQLPMIGKRNQFSKFKVVKTTPVQSSKTTAAKAFGSDDEEFEEENEEPEKLQEEKPNTEKSVEVVKEVVKQNKEELIVELEPVKQTEKPMEDQNIDTKSYEPPIQPPEILTKLTNDSKEDVVSEFKATDEDSARHCNEINAKRRNQRRRKRNKCSEMDEEQLEEHESTEKYAKWVPPENQSGDGFTKLNEKYGY